MLCITAKAAADGGDGSKMRRTHIEHMLSAYHPIATIERTSRKVSKDSDILRALFDHLVGGQQQTGRHFEAERSGGLHVDDKLELGRLEDR